MSTFRDGRKAISAGFGWCILVVASGAFAQEPVLSAPAVVRAKAEAQFSSSLSGTIRALPFGDGASFSQGDLLVGLDCDIQRAEAEAAAADNKGAQAEFQARRALFARGGVGSVEVSVAEAQAAATQARQRLAQAVVSTCEIVAPFAGRVVETLVNEFEYVQSSQPLLSIVSGERPELEINAPAVWLRWMQVGSDGRVEFEALDNSFPVRISSIGAAIDPVSATIKVTAEFADDISGILPGMSGLVRFQ